MNKQIFHFSILLLALFSSTAMANSYVYCSINPNALADFKNTFDGLIMPTITSRLEEDYCWIDEENIRHCTYKDVFYLPNRTVSMGFNANVTCVNFGNQKVNLSYTFVKTMPPTDLYSTWKNLTFRVSGIGAQKTVSNIENMELYKAINWKDGLLMPCTKNCEDLATAMPRYNRTINITASIQPRRLKLSYASDALYNLLDYMGDFFIEAQSDDESLVGGIDTIMLCGLMVKGCLPTGGGGPKPPVERPKPPACTLTIKTPDTVTFQPISSDDLSRNRVRVEDFSLTAIKGPDQSSSCMGSTYNLPGKIKTEGGYSINSTFWGINHSSGVPQGIGLKLYDLDKATYLQFNHEYSSFIKDISSISESKKIRAEISATTQDIKKIKDGRYSQVLTFEVRMP